LVQQNPSKAIIYIFLVEKKRGIPSIEYGGEKRADTVGEPPSAEIRVSHMPAWKAKTLGNLIQERVLLEP
jgi:hypothetical protein